jgi:hypothetical protein
MTKIRSSKKFLFLFFNLKKKKKKEGGARIFKITFWANRFFHTFLRNIISYQLFTQLSYVTKNHRIIIRV